MGERRLADRDLSAMGQAIDFGALERGATEPYAPETGHFYDRLFPSGESYDAAGRLCSESTDPCVNEGINLKQDPASPGGSPEAMSPRSVRLSFSFSTSPVVSVNSTSPSDIVWNGWMHRAIES